MDNTIILQGSFTQGATAVPQTIQLRSDVDWMKVYNYTQFANAVGAGQGIEYYWQRGMAQGTGLAWNKEATIEASVGTVLAAPTGFTLVDSSVQTPAALNNGSTGITAISNATPPVVTVGSTAGMSAGTIVRLYNVTNAQQVGGIDFTVGINTLTGTTFDLSYAPTLGATIGAAGSFRVIPFNPIFYPRNRVITKVTTGTTTTITFSVTHGYTVGQQLRFNVPSGWGMVELNELDGTVLSINTTTNSITVDIDSSSFTAFTFLTNLLYPITPAQAVPFGEDTPYALSQGVDILGGATINTAYIGMYLPAGANSPGGAANDLVYWVAGKSFSNNGM